MINKNDLSNNDKKEFSENIFIYKIVFQDESFIEKNFPYTYKNKNKFNFFKNLLTNFPIKIESINETSYEAIYKLICNIIKIDKGQHLLKMFPYREIIKSIPENEKSLIQLYFISGVSSTLPVFLMIDDLIEDKGVLDLGERSIMSAACRNSDVRILKYIVNNFHQFNKPTWNNEKFVKIYLSFFSSHSNKTFT